MHLLESLLYMASEIWEARQVSELLQHGQREYKKTVQAMCTLEAEGHARALQLLKSSEFWCMLSPLRRTVRTRCLVFRLVSKMLCCLEQNLTMVNKTMPNPLWLLLEDGDKEWLLKFPDELPQCFKDSWSEMFLERVEGRLTCEAARAVLICIAETSQNENIRIESLMASVRRWLLLMSTNTHTAHFEDLVANWNCHRIRNRVLPVQPPELPKQLQSRKVACIPRDGATIFLLDLTSPPPPSPAHGPLARVGGAKTYICIYLFCFLYVTNGTPCFRAPTPTPPPRTMTFSK
jgi:hypothetical protein